MSINAPWSPLSKARIRYAERRRGEGFVSAPEDDPRSPDFVSLEQRSEMNKTRWHFRHKKSRKKIIEFE